MKSENVDALVLATVNAPYSVKLDVSSLIACLREPVTMRTVLGPMSSFFYDVDLDLQRRFALSHDISMETLKAAAEVFGTWSGIRWAGDRAA
jgi:hypothetical protein